MGTGVGGAEERRRRPAEVNSMFLSHPRMPNRAKRHRSNRQHVATSPQQTTQLLPLPLPEFEKEHLPDSDDCDEPGSSSTGGGAGDCNNARTECAVGSCAMAAGAAESREEGEAGLPSFDSTSFAGFGTPAEMGGQQQLTGRHQHQQLSEDQMPSTPRTVGAGGPTDRPSVLTEGGQGSAAQCLQTAGGAAREQDCVDVSVNSKWSKEQDKVILKVGIEAQKASASAEAATDSTGICCGDSGTALFDAAWRKVSSCGSLAGITPAVLHQRFVELCNLAISLSTDQEGQSQGLVPVEKAMAAPAAVISNADTEEQ